MFRKDNFESFAAFASEGEPPPMPSKPTYLPEREQRNPQAQAQAKGPLLQSAVPACLLDASTRRDKHNRLRDELRSIRIQPTIDQMQPTEEEQEWLDEQLAAMARFEAMEFLEEEARLEQDRSFEPSSEGVFVQLMLAQDPSMTKEEAESQWRLYALQEDDFEDERGALVAPMGPAFLMPDAEGKQKEEEGEEERVCSLEPFAFDVDEWPKGVDDEWPEAAVATGGRRSEAEEAWREAHEEKVWREAHEEKAWREALNEMAWREAQDAFEKAWLEAHDQRAWREATGEVRDDECQARCPSPRRSSFPYRSSPLAFLPFGCSPGNSIDASPSDGSPPMAKSGAGASGSGSSIESASES